MRALVFQNAPAPYRTPLFRALDKKFDLMVLYAVRSTGDRLWHPEEGGYSHHYLEGLNLRLKGKTLTWARGLRPFLKEREFDVYYLSDDWRCVVSSLTLARHVRKAGKKAVLWCGGIDTPYRRRVMIPRPAMRAYVAAMGRIAARVDAFLAYGPKTIDYFQRQFGIRRELCRWGTQAAEMEPGAIVPDKKDAPSTVNFLFLGYLERRKGLQDAIRAVRRLSRFDIKLTIAGRGKDEHIFRDLAGSDPRIEFVGYVEGDAKRDCLLRADVMVSPTYHDPWANTINEACLHGLPVITTPAEGAEGTLAVDGYNAVVVPPGDVSRLAEALAFFLEHKERIAVLGRNSQSLASKFDFAWAVSNFVDAANLALGRD